MSDQYLRQESILSSDLREDKHAMIIGIGAVGRQIAILLAAMGIPRLTLIDFDEVEEVNLASQSYWPSDIGNAKVYATASLIKQLNPLVDVDTYFRPWEPDDHQSPIDATFSAVDTMKARTQIWARAKHSTGFWGDTRVAGEQMRILTSSSPHDNRYRNTLFPDSEAIQGPCTGQMTLYAASMAAAAVVGQFTSWLRGYETEADTLINMLASQWFANPQQEVA